MRRAEIIERLEKADGPSRELDLAILPLWEPQHEALRVWPEPYQTELSEYGFSAWKEGSWVSAPLPRFTASLDAASALVERTLPGWWWKVGTCSVSDDACLAPDFNCPVHGERLKAELGYDTMKAGDEFDTGFDVDRRPSGNLPLALLSALFRALSAREAKDGE